jgi:NADH-quinone oxidoreductase subunit H
MKFGLFFLADLLEVVLGAALVTTLFFGGWQVPFLGAEGFQFPWGVSWILPHWSVVVLSVLAFILKTLFFCFFFMTIRWTLPRFRYDQLMHLGWKIMLPIALINIVVTAFLILMKGTLS